MVEKRLGCKRSGIWMGYETIFNMVMTSERGQNTHSKGERVKIPLLPNNLDKRECSQPWDHTSGHDSWISNPHFIQSCLKIGCSLFRCFCIFFSGKVYSPKMGGDPRRGHLSCPERETLPRRLSSPCIERARWDVLHRNCQSRRRNKLKNPKCYRSNLQCVYRENWGASRSP